MESFIDVVVTKLKKIMPDYYDISQADKIENNGLKIGAISIREHDDRTAPLFTVCNYVSRIIDDSDRTLSDDELSDKVADAIVHDYLAVGNECKNQSSIVDTILSFDKCRDYIRPKLVNMEMNSELLESVPYDTWLDLAVYPVIEIPDGNNECVSRVNVTYDLIASWSGVTTEEVLNTMNSNPIDILVEPMENLLAAGGVETIDIPVEMIILTNKNKNCGACAVLQKDVLASYAEKWDSNILIIPSSIHEVILVPCDDFNDSSSYNQMIREVNDTQLAGFDILSDHAYGYLRESGDYISL